MIQISQHRRRVVQKWETLGAQFITYNYSVGAKVISSENLGEKKPEIQQQASFCSNVRELWGRRLGKKKIL